VNGENAMNGQFPWSGHLSSAGRSCSCSLIRSDRVLTAAHCVPDLAPGTVFFGNVIRGQGISRIFAGSDVFIHPNWVSAGGFDIAVLRLPQPYDITGPLLSPISLPVNGLNFFENMQGVMHGFGRMAGDVQAQILQWTPFISYSRAECAALRPGHVHVVCGRYPSASTCAGDSGGGFVMNDGGVMRIIGVHSFRFGTPTCTGGDLGVSVRVSDHLQFILSV
jgi:hypothetical protein